MTWYRIENILISNITVINVTTQATTTNLNIHTHFVHKSLVMSVTKQLKLMDDVMANLH